MLNAEDLMDDIKLSNCDVLMYCSSCCIKESTLPEQHNQNQETIGNGSQWCLQPNGNLSSWWKEIFVNIYWSLFYDTHSHIFWKRKVKCFKNSKNLWLWRAINLVGNHLFYAHKMGVCILEKKRMIIWKNMMSNIKWTSQENGVAENKNLPLLNSI